MRITADTNLLVRIVVEDDRIQTGAALRVFEKAQSVALPLPCLCEFVWVLGSVYGLPKDAIAMSLQAIVERRNVVVDGPAVRAGLRTLEAGGDFADGAIAASGASMGGEIFLSFDRKAVARVAELGLAANHPADVQ